MLVPKAHNIMLADKPEMASNVLVGSTIDVINKYLQVLARPAFDPDALAYIAQIEQFVTVTQGRRDLLNDWFTTGKASGWYQKIKRIIFTVWDNASPNAVDVKDPSKTVTFNGTVNHENTYAQGDGTASDYTDFGTDPNTEGMGINDGFLACYIANTSLTGSDTVTDMGALNSVSQETIVFAKSVANLHIFDYCDTSGGRVISSAHTDNNGVYLGNRLSGVRGVGRATTASNYAEETETDANSGTVPTVDVYGMAYNAAGTATNPSSRQYRMFAFGLGLTLAQRTSFANKTFEVLNAF